MPDLSDAVNWSEVDANNNQAPPNGWPEGMMPSTVNDAARADRGALKRFWNKINPVQSIVPASGIWQFTTGNPTYPAAYLDGEIYCFRPSGPSVGGDQFQINSLGLKPIWKHYQPAPSGWIPIVAQDIVGNVMVELTYQAALNGGAGAFVMLNPNIPISNDGTGNLTVGSGITVNGAVTANTVVAGYVTSNSGLSVTGNSTLNGAVNANTVTAGYVTSNSGLSVTGTSTLNGTVNANTVVAGSVTSNGALSVTTGGLSVTGNSTFNGTVTANTVTAGYVTSNSGLSVTGTSTLNGAVNANTVVAGYVTSNSGINVVSGDLTVAAGNAYKPGGGPWSATSDVRLKTDVHAYTAGLAAIIALQPVTYKFNGRGGTTRDGRRFVGLVADEVEDVMPEMVGKISRLLDPDDKEPAEIKILDTTALTFALVNCCKELAARVAALEAQIAVQG